MATIRLAFHFTFTNLIGYTNFKFAVFDICFTVFDNRKAICIIRANPYLCRRKIQYNNE